MAQFERSRRILCVIHGRDAGAIRKLCRDHHDWSLASSCVSRYYLASNMSNSDRFTIVCPCCEATLNIDAETGALLSHEEKAKPLGSFEDLVKDRDKQKQTRDQLFAQEMTSFKDRSRLLEEKFQEAKKKAEKDTKIYRNPLDLD